MCGMNFLTKVKNKLQYEYDKLRWKRNEQAVAKSWAWQNVATIDETLDKLLSEPCSMCRYGDGEYKVMAGGSNGFQKPDAALAKRLRQVLRSDEPGLLVCIPNVKSEMELRVPFAKNFWVGFLRDHGHSWSHMLDTKKKYYNTQVTRLYIDYLRSDLSEQWYKRIRQLWQDKDLLIVEGEKTRMGYGNDLLENAKSIRRILCPSQHAFGRYDEILAKVKEIWNGELVLIALGQTATVLAHDLHCAGIRALDVGHIDIEYEWFRAGVQERTAIPGKYVKEVQDELHGGDAAPEVLAQVVAKVGVE